MKGIVIIQYFFSFLFLIIINLIITVHCLSMQCNNNNIFHISNHYFNEEKYCHKNEKNNINDSIDIINYDFCIKCQKKKKKLNRKCKKKCSAKRILKNIKIISAEDTLNEIIYNNKSISRFGDGEFNLIFGIGIKFQKRNKNISKRLKDVLLSNEKDLLIGIPDSLNLEYLNNFIPKTKRFWKKWIKKNRFKLIFLHKKKKYYSSYITRFYIIRKDKSNVSKYIMKLKKIWEKKDVLIIEGEKSRLGVDNDLFDNIKSIQRILCPSKNAFFVYNKILKEALKTDKKKLILLALGPTATILAYDLYKAGYQVVDVGHVDIEYEWFLKNATSKIIIEGKYVNEVKGGNKNINNVKDKNYYNQIIAKILK